MSRKDLKDLNDFAYMMTGVTAGFLVWLVFIWYGIQLDVTSVVYMLGGAIIVASVSFMMLEIMIRIHKNKEMNNPTRANFISYSELIKK